MAPSAAAVEIRDIFDEIISNNLRYCALCLRTEKERRLVEPKSFMKCLGIMQLQVPEVNTICYVCEAAAARTVTLFHAISFSFVINRWFKDMSSKLKYKDEMPNHLERYYESKSARAASLPGLEAAPLPQVWRRIRGYHQLVQTEVLVVGDSQPSMADRDVVEIIAGPRVAPPPPQQIIQEPVMENVVIIEDEVLPPEAQYVSEPCEGASAEFVQLDQLSEPCGGASTEFVQLDQLSEPCGGASTEFVQLDQLSEPCGAASTEFVQLDQLSEAPAAAFVSEDMQVLGSAAGGFVLQALVRAGDGALYVPARPAPRVTITSMEVIKQAEPSEHYSYPAQQHAPAQLAPEWAQWEACAGAESAQAARPEDMIPKNDISFVDATDPLASQLLASPTPRKRPKPHVDLC